MAIMANAVQNDGKISFSTSRTYNNSDKSLSWNQIKKWELIVESWKEDFAVDYKNGFPVMIDYHTAKNQLFLWRLRCER